jgi:hypothetical protein
MANMTEDNYRLYVDKDISHYETFEAAKDAAKLFMPSRACLRIEILADVSEGEADFWAYEYEANQWVPS